MIKRLLEIWKWITLKRIELENDRMKYSVHSMPRKDKP